MIHLLTSTANSAIISAGLAVLFSWRIVKGSQDFLHTSSMVLYHKWYVKNSFAYVLQFFSPISDGLGGVCVIFWIIMAQKQSSFTS